jgi:hypothetical protein
MDILYILWYLTYIFSCFGILCQEKSGNPADLLPALPKEGLCVRFKEWQCNEKVSKPSSRAMILLPWTKLIIFRTLFTIRVTRLGDFSLLGDCLLWAVF